MYLRMGWVVGNAGLFGTVLIVTMSSLITLLTGFSIAATATNMKVGGGGAYFILSRSLGLETGASIGIPLFFAQALGISFYIVGFSEAFSGLFPQFEPTQVGIVSLVVLTVLSIVSANLAMKTQLLIFGVIVASLVSIFAGKPQVEGFTASTVHLQEADFWGVFAVFFPAVTGILAGVTMSGDLKNPSKSIPVGTLAAIVTGYVVYLSIAVFLYFIAETEVLQSNPTVLVQISRWKQVVVAGIWGATLSSALGSILSAPRTLQALAKDGIIPSFLGKGFGRQGNPRIATALSFAVAFICIILGDLNAIAPILSMFFLSAYGMLNFSSGIESLIGNPSWRPTFKVHWMISMLGALGCFSVMMLINAGAAIISLIIVFSIYIYIQRKHMDSNLDDIRRSILMYLTKHCIYALGKLASSPKCWSPNLLVLSGDMSNRWNLTDIAKNISRGKGFLTISSIVPRHHDPHHHPVTVYNNIRKFLDEQGVGSLVEVVAHDDVRKGAKLLVQHYGIGALKPNTVILGRSGNEDEFVQFADLIQAIYASRKNLMIVLDPTGQPDETPKTGRIDIWWWGEGHEKQNSSLALAIGYLLKLSEKWKKTRLCLKVIATSDSEKQQKEVYLKNLLDAARLDVELDIHVPETTNYFKVISEKSRDAALTLIGMRPPMKDEPDEDYSVYYEGLLFSTEELSHAVLVMAAEEIEFDEIFV